MKRKHIIIGLLVITLVFLPVVFAEDIQIWQGQYYKGTDFQVGTFEFNFTVYDNATGGVPCYSNITTLTTGNFGEWKTQQTGLGTMCNNLSTIYFLEISINGEKQSPRRRLNLILLRDSRLINNIVSDNFQINSSLATLVFNRSGFVRNTVKNLNSEPNTTVINTLENDAGHQFSMVLTSSTYNLTGPNRSNLGAISLNAPAPMWFSVRYYQPFIWKNNPADDGALVGNQTDLMRLEREGNLILPLGGINATGNITTMNTGFFGQINLSGNLTISDQILTNSGCLIPHANFWGERTGTITTGGAPAGLQYSFGDGNTDGGQTQPCSGKVVYITVNAQTANNGNGRVAIVVNSGLNSSCNIATPSTSGGTTQTNCSLLFNASDTLTPRTTITPTGQNSGYVVSWWVVYD